MWLLSGKFFKIDLSFTPVGFGNFTLFFTFLSVPRLTSVLKTYMLQLTMKNSSYLEKGVIRKKRNTLCNKSLFFEGRFCSNKKGNCPE